jgi:hypothetical protein
LDSAKGIKRDEFLRAVRAVTGLQVLALLSPFPQSCRSVDVHDFLRRNPEQNCFHSTILESI